MHLCTLIKYEVGNVLGFYVPPTDKVIQTQDLGLKDWRSPR